MKLDYKKVFFVGLAFFLISMFWQTYDSVITKILIDKFGLNQTWSGVVMALDNILALFLLPLFGGLSDKTNAKMGRRTPYIIVGTIVAAFAFVGLSFADNYQTLKIESETTIVEEYEEYMFEKETMQGMILVTEDEVLQPQMDVTNAEMEEDNEEMVEKHDAGTLSDEKFAAWQEKYSAWQTEYAEMIAAWPVYVAKWQTNNLLVKAQRDALQTEREGTLFEGVSTFFYNRWIEKNYNPMVLAANNAIANGGLTQPEYSFWSDEIFDGIYDANLSEQAWEMTSDKPGTFIVFSMVLLVALISMATFRSPAVALMPDVTVKPLRSKANAIINLMGTFGGILAIGILAVLQLDKVSYLHYTGAFVAVGVLMLVLLGIFLWKVKEPRLVQEKMDEEVKYGLVEEEEKKDVKVEPMPRDKRQSLTLILISVFLWFIGYNAVTTKFADYAPKVLGMGYTYPLLIAQGAALIAFVPIGFLATKIGRRKTILIGITVLATCFLLASFIRDTGSGTTTILMYAIFAFTGIGWATINVNSYPMVVELSKGSNVGKYTGYYYTFSMAAQILTPILSGILMDAFDRKVLFPYATIFVAAAFITMFFVKHGDAQVAKKATTLENFDVDMD